MARALEAGYGTLSNTRVHEVASVARSLWERVQSLVATPNPADIGQLIRLNSEELYPLNPTQIQLLVDALCQTQMPYLHHVRALIQNQKIGKYTLTPDQIEQLIDTMRSARDPYLHDVRQLIQEQESKSYALTPEQVQNLVYTMTWANSQKGFREICDLVTNQLMEWYRLSPSQVNLLVNKAIHEETRAIDLRGLIHFQNDCGYMLTPLQLQGIVDILCKIDNKNQLDLLIDYQSIFRYTLTSAQIEQIRYAMTQK